MMDDFQHQFFILRIDLFLHISNSSTEGDDVMLYLISGKNTQGEPIVTKIGKWWTTRPSPLNF